MTLGTKVPELIGEDFQDGAGERHPGLITSGLPVLRAPAGDLPALRARAVEAEVGVIGFPAFGQTTNDYDAFRAMIAGTEAPAYLGLAFYGPARRSAGSPGASACCPRAARGDEPAWTGEAGA